MKWIKYYEVITINIFYIFTDEIVSFKLAFY